MATEILEELGLSHAEAKIYLTLLELGTSKTGQIILSAKLQSSTVYHVLQSLIEKGLVSYILNGKIKYYQAESPEVFLLFLEEKKLKFVEVLPVLKEKEKLGKTRQSARVYEGIKGLKTAFNDILTSLKSGDEYYFFQVPKEKLFNKDVLLFFRSYHTKRAERGIKVKGLAVKESKNLVKKIFHNIKCTRIRYVDEFIPHGIVIYRNKVIMLDWDKSPTAFVIESETIASSYKRFFEEKWNDAAK